jgi:acyl-CoA oxidase
VDYGIHIFIVPLRDPETGQCLPGVSCGDLGPKMGRKQNDNGWILFSHVRIPRTNMLMRWAQVTEKGEYLAPSFPQISYATLINERVMLTAESLSVTSLGVVVAVRYSAIRRQGEKDNQILYYQSQQYRVIPILANWFGYHFGIRAITNQLKALWKTMDSNPDQSLNMFPDLHAISSCMKAYATWWTMQSLELCRQCLGGHGYSEYSAIPSLLGDFGVLTTGGGDNVVLAQQTARYLVGCYKRAHLGKKIVGSADYLNDFQSLLKQRVSVFSEADWDNPTTILTVWKLLAVHSIHHAALRLQQETEKLGTDKSAAWNECMMDLVSLAFIHNYYFLFLHFSQALSTITDPALNRVMHRLCIVMGLSRLEEKWGSLLEFGLLNPEHGKLLRNQIRKYINELTPDAVTIVDGFNYPDFIVNSPFGRYDGDIYTHYMKALKETPFTQGPPSYFNSLIKPLVSKL